MLAATDAHVIETAMARVVMAFALKHHTRRGEGDSVKPREALRVEDGSIAAGHGRSAEREPGGRASPSMEKEVAAPDRGRDGAWTSGCDEVGFKSGADFDVMDVLRHPRHGAVREGDVSTSGKGNPYAMARFGRTTLRENRRCRNG